ncbi:MAG: TIGR00730 family Rossman fold protein [Planctomycetaceae bacterium]
MAAVCVFCGSQSGLSPAHTQAAVDLGKTLVACGHSLIYGGGSTGMMGALADAMLERGGHVIGVIPEALANVELMHTQVVDMRIVPDMHVRKATMHKLADVYIALPGGFGTMEELFEALCWAQLEFHTAPVVVLNVDGLFDGLARLVEDMIQQGFLKETYRGLLTMVSSVAELEQWLIQTVVEPV